MAGGQGPQTEVASIDLNQVLNAPKNILDSQRLAVRPGETDKPAQVVSEAKSPVLGDSFDRSKFVLAETTGVNIAEKHHQKIHTLEQKTVEFSPELRSQFESFLTTHVENLLKITNPQVLDNPTHLHEKMLLKQLTTDNQLDKSKLANFLKTDEGWSITEKLLEHQTALKLVSVGLEASINPQGKKVTKINEHTISLHVDQGELNHLIKERLGHWLNERAMNVGGRPTGDWRDRVSRGGLLAGSIGGTGLFSGIGAAVAAVAHGDPAVGALLGLGVPAAEGVIHLARNGVEIDINQSVEALKVLKKMPGEREYMRAVLDIDIDALRVQAGVGGGPPTIQETPNHTFMGRSMDVIKNEIYQGLLGRLDFYKALGVEPEMDSLPEQFLFQANPASAEQTALRLDKRILEIMDFNNPNVRAMSEHERLRRFIKAREQAMTEQLDGLAIKIVEGTDSTKAITRIESKIARKDKGGVEVQERKDRLMKNKAELEKAKDKLKDPDQAAKDYQKARDDLTAAQESFTRDFPTEAAAGITAHLTVNQTIDRTIAELNRSLTDGTLPTSISARRQGLHTAKQTALIAQKTAAIAALSPKAQGDPETVKDVSKAVTEALNDSFKDQFAELDNAAAEITTRIANLKSIKTQLEKAQKDLPTKEQALLGHSARVNLTTVDANHNTVDGTGVGGAPPTIGLTDPQLSALTVDELMAEINRVHATTPGVGWAAANNNDPANRQMVIDAISEAKARFKESIDPEKPARDVDYTNITSWGITADQLRTLTRAQLLNMIHIQNGINAANGWALGPDDATRGPELDRAIAEAKNRMILRYGGIVSEQITDLQTRMETIDSEITNINFENDVDILTVIKDAMGRQSQIFDKAYQLAINRQRYVDTTPVGPNDNTYSQSERDQQATSGYSKGYWEMMDSIFGYKERADRGSYVLKIIKALPPDALARQINDSLRQAGLRNIPGHANPNYSNLDLALTALDRGLDRRSFNNFDGRRMYADLINNLRTRADAL